MLTVDDEDDEDEVEPIFPRSGVALLTLENTFLPGNLLLLTVPNIAHYKNITDGLN